MGYKRNVNNWFNIYFISQSKKGYDIFIVQITVVNKILFIQYVYLKLIVC